MPKLKNDFWYDEKDGIIYQCYCGDQNFETVEQLDKPTLVLAQKLRSENKPVLLALDLSSLTHHDSGSHKASYDFLTVLPFDKLAFFGADTYARGVGEMILQSLGLIERARAFQDKESALNWLKS